LEVDEHEKKFLILIRPVGNRRTREENLNSDQNQHLPCTFLTVCLQHLVKVQDKPFLQLLKYIAPLNCIFIKRVDVIVKRIFTVTSMQTACNFHLGKCSWSCMQVLLMDLDNCWSTFRTLAFLTQLTFITSFPWHIFSVLTRHALSSTMTGTLFRTRNAFCWIVRMNILSAFAHSTASWSSHLNMRMARQLVWGPFWTNPICLVLPLS